MLCFAVIYAIIKLWSLESMTRIRCVAERITFQSPETGYSVLKVSVKGYQELVTVAGNLADAVAALFF